METITVIPPKSRFGIVEINATRLLMSFREEPLGAPCINIRLFVFERTIFSQLDANDMLGGGTLRRLAEIGELGAVVHEGFWEPMDKVPEFAYLNHLWETGAAGWKVWD